MKNNQEGPSMREIPSQRQRVCGDCKFHVKERWMCGHRRVTDNYSCTHPDLGIAQEFIFSSGRTIAFNSEETPSTPEWCPFLKTNQ